MPRTIQARVVRSERRTLCRSRPPSPILFAQRAKHKLHRRNVVATALNDWGLANTPCSGGKKTSQTFAARISPADATRGLHLP
jgi:hypothetical protein